MYEAAVDALQSSDDETESRRRFKEFKKEFDKLDPRLKDAYLLRVFTKGMRRKTQKQMANQPLSIEDKKGSVPGKKKTRAIMPASSSTAVMPYGMIASK